MALLAAPGHRQLANARAVKADLASEEKQVSNAIWNFRSNVKQYKPGEDDALWRAAVGPIRVVEGTLSNFEPPTATSKSYCLLLPNGNNKLQYAQFKWEIGPSGTQCGEETRFKLVPFDNQWWKLQHADGSFAFLGDGGVSVWWMGNNHPATKFGVMHRNDGAEIAFWSPDHKCVIKNEGNNYSKCRAYNKDAVDEYRFWFSAWKLGVPDNWKANLDFRTVWEIDGCLIPDDSTMSVTKSLKVGRTTSETNTHTVTSETGASVGFFSISFKYEGSTSLGESYDEEQTIEIPGDVAPGQIMMVQQLMGEWGPSQLRTSKIRYSCRSCTTGKEEACTHGSDYFHVTIDSGVAKNGENPIAPSSKLTWWEQFFQSKKASNKEITNAVIAAIAPTLTSS